VSRRHTSTTVLLLVACGCGKADKTASVDTEMDATDQLESGAGTASCAAGCVVTLATGGSPWAIAVDETSVYWLSTTGVVSKVPLDGGTVVTLASGLDSPFGLAIDRVNAYFTAGPSVLSVPLTGGSIATHATIAGTSGTGIGVNATRLCWIAGTNVMCMPVSATGTEPIAVGPAAEARYLTMDATNVYWTGEDGYVRMAPTDGSAPATVIASGQTDPLAIAVSATSAYWTTPTGDAGLVQAPIGGGAARALAPGPGYYGIALDESSVYFSGAAGLVTVPLDGGAPRMFDAGSGAVQGMAIDATSLYLAVVGPGAVMKVTPKGL
jgi:hypothetical protein